MPSVPQLSRRFGVRSRRWLRTSEAAFIVLAATVGVLAGIGMMVQQALAHGLQRLLYGVTINRLSALGSIHHPWRLVALPLGGLALIALNQLIARRTRAPIDVVEANALHGGRIPASDNLIIAAQTILSNGCGASVGLEATYAQLGGGAASLLGQWFQLRRGDLRTLVGAGAGAAVGAAFGAPLTGAFYAFEIVIGAYNTTSVAPVIVATLAATLVIRAVGVAPYLIATTVVRQLTILDYGIYSLLGLLCAGLGIVVMRLVTTTDRLLHNLTGGSRWRPLIGGLLLVPLAWLSPQTLSAGHGALNLDLTLQPAVSFLLIVLALKIAASVLSLASGFRGGLFFASLFLGALLGEAFAAAINLNPWGIALEPTDAALVGMAAFSACIVGGPMTLALLMLETTHDFALMGVVLTASLVAGATTREVFGYSFSTWRLHVRGSNVRSPRDIGWMHDLTPGRIMRHDWKSVPESTTVAVFRTLVPLGSASKAIVIAADGTYQGIVPTAAAYSPDIDPQAPVKSLAVLPNTWLRSSTDIKSVLATFDAEAADELAVVEHGEVVGVLSEAYARRRYLEEVEIAQRQLFGEA